MFKSSLSHFRNVRALTICGLMMALAVVLNYVATIRIGSYIRIGFSFLPNLIVDFLFGPVVGGVFGGLLDIIKYILTPSGSFFPGFTISAILGAVIYGVILYRKTLTWTRMILAQFLVKLIVNIGLNSLWLKIMYGQALLAILPGRILSNAVMLPIDVIIGYIALKMVAQYRRQLMPGI
ncbi:MAG: folate family ECF transporter S component [Lachnospiraceae bacterium]|nr:folate family ECF transporter S component [Candidatus Equihabitans merdae]